MTIIQRLKGILAGLGVIILGLFMMLGGIFIGWENIIAIIIGILGLFLLFTGIRYLIYYFKTGRFVVGGKMILYIGIISLDFGLFTLSLSSSPVVIVVVYLIAFYAFAGLVDILRAFEAKKQEGP